MADATNVTWHAGVVDKASRAAHLKQRGCLIWFTGLSGSGKSTLSVALEEYLMQHGFTGYRLDGDNIRHGLNSNLGFDSADRTENIRRIGEVGKLFVDAGLITLAAFISPYQADRDQVRALLEPGEFVEVYVECSVEACAKRDVKGLYAKAQAGEIKDFTGVSAPYEIPMHPEITINTETQSLESALEQLVRALDAGGYLKRQ